MGDEMSWKSFAPQPHGDNFNRFLNGPADQYVHFAIGQSIRSLTPLRTRFSYFLRLAWRRQHMATAMQNCSRKGTGAEALHTVRADLGTCAAVRISYVTERAHAISFRFILSAVFFFCSGSFRSFPRRVFFLGDFDRLA